jgi:hypothetical protein
MERRGHLDAVSKLIHQNLDEGDIQTGRDYLRADISRIKVDDQNVSIIG